MIPPVEPLSAELVLPLARCHIDSWRESFRHLVPAHVLAAFAPERSVATWERWRRDGEHTIVLARDGDAVAGFAAATADELCALYVRAAHQGTGLADALFGAVVAPGTARALWVFADNPRAHAFYTRHGFADTGDRRVDPITLLTEERWSRPGCAAGAAPQYSRIMSADTAVDLTDGVLTLTIATAGAGTSMNFDLVNAGTAALRAAGDEVGAVLLTGSGANFCAGGNVRDFAAAEDRSAYLAELAGELHEFVRALEAVELPVVAAVQGWAAGAGMSLVCAADIAIGGPSTKLRPAYPGIGLSPDGGMSWSLPRIVGKSRAAEILLTDAVIDAEEAVRLGILSRLVADADVLAEATTVARSFVAGPRSTYAAMKRLLAVSSTSTLDAQLDRERDGIAAAAGTPAGREGVNAFIEKRKPDYTAVN